MQKALRILFITQCPPPTSLLFLTFPISLQLSTLHLLTPIALVKRVHLTTLNTFCLGSYCLPSSLISSMAYSSLFSITVINTMIQSNWAWTGSISPYSLYHWGEVMAWTQAGQDVEAGPEAEVIKEWYLLALLSTQFRTTYPGVAPPRVSWALPHQLLIKKTPRRLACRSIWWIRFVFQLMFTLPGCL